MNTDSAVPDKKAAKSPARRSLEKVYSPFANKMRPEIHAGSVGP